MEPVYFWKRDPDYYKKDKWRGIFCQWYEKDFKGGKACHDLASIIDEKDWAEYVDQKTFSSREKWMMVIKTLMFAKGDHRQDNLNILDNQMVPTDDPGKIRELGRTVKGFDEKIWDEWKYKIVVNGNYLQFSQDKEMRDILMKTGTAELVEASPKDRIWGIGYEEKKATKVSRSQWGLNLLGLALVEVRAKLTKEST